MTNIPLRPDLGVLQSCQENTSSSFQSKLQISPPSSNEPISPQLLNPLLDNISDVPSRPSNPQPLQIHPSLDITLSLSPITPLDHIHDTHSHHLHHSSTTIRATLFTTTTDYMGQLAYVAFHNRTLFYNPKRCR
ncbi:hypothetical protein Tco_0766600 [Tanacetum coccineum]